jgi:hypothetical protein
MKEWIVLLVTCVIVAFLMKVLFPALPLLVFIITGLIIGFFWNSLWTAIFKRNR